MTETLRRGSPPRSPERVRLQYAQQAHHNALQRQSRITEAQQRLDSEFYGVIKPAVTRAQETLEAARANAPQRLLDSLLGDDEPGVRSHVADGVVELAEAERRVEEAREARQMLAQEAERAAFSASTAEKDLTAAVEAVVAAEKRAVEVEFRRAARRMLRLQKVLMTLRHGVHFFSDEEIGIGFRILDVTNPVTGSSRYTPDPEWLTAVSALRENADAALPGLPEPESDDAGDGAPAEAA